MTSFEIPDASTLPNEPSTEPSVSARENKKAEGKSNLSPVFLEFTEKLKGFPTPEEKVTCGLQFMREMISQEGSPQFREFWESRKLVLPMFKENLNTAIRSKLWAEYIELTVEARQLKEILEQQSAFAMEQIDLAVQGVESDLGRFDALLEEASPPSFQFFPRTIQSSLSQYTAMQSELGLFNVLASRLSTLRKEVMKTDMRIRFKTKFFKRLSELGDQVFPKRKALIEQVSNTFLKDVEQFISRHFKGGEVTGAPCYALREEIKTFQSLAKQLTLNSAVFGSTRTLMSQCWDQVRSLEKEHKKVLQEKKEASSGAVEAFKEKIEALKAGLEGMSLFDLDRKLDEIQKEMRSIYLDREDIQDLRAAMAALRAPLVAEKDQKAKELEEAEKEKLRIKKEKLNALKEQIPHVIQAAASQEVDQIVEQFQGIEAEMVELSLSKMEKQLMDRLLRPLKDLITEKKEQSMMNLSEDDRKYFENYRLVLEQRQNRRQEIKAQIDAYRKALGASNLDFEKAFQYKELLDQEKEHLEKATLAVAEIEEKLKRFEG